uniref:ZAD domain-containing protein n=1 Tax=Lutzomyia longipalpis TaxID=7200 RepID=A0A1B0CT85_LUTLO
MMNVFKVHISKKLMACATIQVWQNDGLPTQICTKCVAKLHIAFQFKKLCEKSDARLRHYLANPPGGGAEETHNEERIPSDYVYVDCPSGESTGGQQYESVQATIQTPTLSYSAMFPYTFQQLLLGKC